MLRLASKQTIPPGGWHIRVNGVDLVAADFGRLYHAWLAQLDEVPLDSLAAFEDELCHQLNAHCEVTTPVTNETRKLSVGDAVRFLKVVKAWAGEKLQVVEQAEADRRSEICAGCRFNVPIEGCSPCAGIAAMIVNVIGDRESRFDAQLKGCAVCACENKSQIHLPLHVLQRGVSNEMVFPDFCWKRSTHTHLEQQTLKPHIE